MTAQQEQTLFNRIGGMAAVNAAVDIFYGKVLADETISHFFANTPMKTQAGKQKAFFGLCLWRINGLYRQKNEGCTCTHEPYRSSL